MPQPVRTDPRQFGALTGVINDVFHSEPQQRTNRRDHAHENSAALQVRPPDARVVTQCFTHIRRKRQALLPITLTADQDFAAPPIYVAQFERSHLTSAQPQAHQQLQDGVVTSPTDPPTIATGEKGSNVLWLKWSW